MPSAISKPELIARTHKTYGTLEALLATLDTAQVMRPRDDETSIKDIIAHRAHWIDLFLGWYRDGQAGKEVYFPAKGYKWNDLKRYNAKLRADQTTLDWDGARDWLNDSHHALVTLLEGLSDNALYAAPMKGAHNHWTTGRWAEAAGIAHYKSATTWIKSCLRQDK